MKIWEKNIPVNKKVETFTVGKDPEYDLYLAAYDVIGSLAHIRMLQQINLLSGEEYLTLSRALKNIYSQIQAGDFRMEEGMEDIHSQIEYLLTKELGETGKKIHAGRSRNDQVLVDLRLFFREEIREIVSKTGELYNQLMLLAERHQSDLLPGYTHLQAAMPSSFGLWFSAFAENLVDDLRLWKAAFDMINHNPLGSGAGYGTSLPLNRTLTTELLGFQDLSYNVIHAQMGRGRSELFLAFALAGTANTLSKLAMDVCLFHSENFGFLKLDDTFTTGSSIMPHKKNPDVFELIRAKCNMLSQLPAVISGAFGFLSSGYHRDFQLLKEQIIPALQSLKSCLEMTHLALQNITIKTNILDDKKYQMIFSVEVVNKLVMEGYSFREAYQKIAQDIQSGLFEFTGELNHTHEGSLGNLCLEKIDQKFSLVRSQFDFSYQEAIEKLIQTL